MNITKEGGETPKRKYSKDKTYKPNEVYTDLENKKTVATNCPYEEYALFCVECDRQGLNLIKHKDYIKLS